MNKSELPPQSDPDFMKKVLDMRKNKPSFPAPKLSEMEEVEILPPEDHKKLYVLLKGSEYPLSQNLPTNKFNGDYDDPEYEKYLKDYGSSSIKEKINEYNKKNPGKIKTDFKYYYQDPTKPKELNPNIGWKLHLNIGPENVKNVSKYLIDNGYDHKYLHGGRITNGKIFTIYIGSHKLTRELAQQISRDLKSCLCRPIDQKETEFALGVSARFVNPKGEGFYQYGFSGGMQTIEDDQKKFTELQLKHIGKKISDEEFKNQFKTLQKKSCFNSYKKLKQIYGEYFTG